MNNPQRRFNSKFELAKKSKGKSENTLKLRKIKVQPTKIYGVWLKQCLEEIL